ncbi:hypothetical protein ACTOVN_05180 [Arcanobacterium canis]
MGKEGSIIIAEKFRNVVHGDQMLPKVISEKVQERIPFRFTLNDFTQLRKNWGIGPVKSGDKKALPKSVLTYSSNHPEAQPCIQSAPIPDSAAVADFLYCCRRSPSVADK